MDCSPPGSPVHGDPPARILEWVAMPFSGGSSCPRDRTKISLIAGRFFTIWATGEAPSRCLKFGIFDYFINYFFLLKEKLNGLFLLQFQTFKSPVLNFLSSRPYGKVSFAAFHLFFFLSTIDTPILHLCCFAQASSSIPLGSSELVNWHAFYSPSRKPSPSPLQSFSWSPARCHFSALKHPAGFYAYDCRHSYFHFLYSSLPARC